MLQSTLPLVELVVSFSTCFAAFNFAWCTSALIYFCGQKGGACAFKVILHLVLKIPKYVSKLLKIAKSGQTSKLVYLLLSSSILIILNHFSSAKSIFLLQNALTILLTAPELSFFLCLPAPMFIIMRAALPKLQSNVFFLNCFFLRK